MLQASIRTDPDCEHKRLSCGCRARKNVKAPIQPQLDLSQLPGKIWKGIAYKPCDGGFQCVWCDHVGKKENNIEQHCRHHFPPQIKCSGCGDEFHLLTQYQQHFLYNCEACGKKIKGLGNLKEHQKGGRCKHTGDTNAEVRPLAEKTKADVPHVAEKTKADVPDVAENKPKVIIIKRRIKRPANSPPNFHKLLKIHSSNPPLLVSLNLTGSMVL